MDYIPADLELFYLPFPVEIIDVTTVGGVPVYSFNEKERDPTGNTWIDTDPGRYGDPDGNPLYELNNRDDVAVGTIVLVWFQGMVGGEPTYMFDAGQAAAAAPTSLSMSNATGTGLAVGTSMLDLTNAATCSVSGTYLVWVRFSAFWQVASGQIAGLQVQLAKNGSGVTVRNIHLDGFGASQNINDTFTWFESVALTAGDTLKAQVQKSGTFSTQPTALAAEAYALKI